MLLTHSTSHDDLGRAGLHDHVHLLGPVLDLADFILLLLRRSGGVRLASGGVYRGEEGVLLGHGVGLLYINSESQSSESQRSLSGDPASRVFPTFCRRAAAADGQMRAEATGPDFV